MPSLSPHARDDTITLLRGMPATQYPRPNRNCGPHTMLVPCSGTTKNSGSPLHMPLWRELISLIQKHSTEKTEDKLAKAWSFPTANEQEDVYKKWTVQDILTYIGRDTTTIHFKIKRFLERIGSPSNDTDVKAFLDQRPDRWGGFR